MIHLFVCVFAGILFGLSDDNQLVWNNCPPTFIECVCVFVCVFLCCERPCTFPKALVLRVFVLFCVPESNRMEYGISNAVQSRQHKHGARFVRCKRAIYCLSKLLLGVRTRVLCSFVTNYTFEFGIPCCLFFFLLFGLYKSQHYETIANTQCRLFLCVCFTSFGFAECAIIQFYNWAYIWEWLFV